MESSKNKTLTKKDITKTYLRWWWTAELSNSFERMQGLAYGATMAPIINKLYADDEEGRIEGLKRHLAFFNTQAIWGSIIVGTTVAMEEEKANGEDIPAEMITSFKTGMMGPLAGIGDSLDFATIQTIFYSLAASFAIGGSILGPMFILAFSVLHFFLGYFFAHIGYREGRKSIADILQSGQINQIIQTAGMIGIFMMGSLSARMVKLETVLEFDVAGSVINLQETLDSIVPGILPLAAVLTVYWAISKKKVSITNIMIIVSILSLVGSFLGIL